MGVESACVFTWVLPFTAQLNYFQMEEIPITGKRYELEPTYALLKAPGGQALADTERHRTHDDTSLIVSLTNNNKNLQPLLKAEYMDMGH